MNVSVTQAITLSIAVLGAVLGLINTWHGLDRTRPKLRVRPAHAIPVGSAPKSLTFCIEVTNLSAFPLTVCEVGVLYHGTDARGTVMPVLIDGGPWPRLLESRASVTVYFQRPEFDADHLIRCAYAKTECGVTKTGTSPALRQVAAGMGPT